MAEAVESKCAQEDVDYDGWVGPTPDEAVPAKKRKGKCYKIKGLILVHMNWWYKGICHSRNFWNCYYIFHLKHLIS